MGEMGMANVSVPFTEQEIEMIIKLSELGHGPAKIAALARLPSQRVAKFLKMTGRSRTKEQAYETRPSSWAAGNRRAL